MLFMLVTIILPNNNTNKIQEYLKKLCRFIIFKKEYP